MNTDIKTDKEAFELVREHLFKQNERSIDEADTCRYRGYSSSVIEQAREQASMDEYGNYEMFYEILNEIDPDLKCAVGFLISDAFYEYNFEERSYIDNQDIRDAVSQSNPNWDRTDSSDVLLVILQSIHDNGGPSIWKKCLDPSNFTFSENGSFKKFILDRDIWSGGAIQSLMGTKYIEEVRSNIKENIKGENDGL